MLNALCFLFGVLVAVEWIAAAYRPIDLRYARKRPGSHPWWRVAIWSAAIALLEGLLPGAERQAFNTGLLFLTIFHTVIYHVGQLIRKRLQARN